MSEKKVQYVERAKGLFQEYNKVLVVTADNVGSKQMGLIRKALRKEAVILMGKNSLMRRAMRDLLEENPKLNELIPYARGNIGFVFTNGDVGSIRKAIVEDTVPAQAKAGAIAPCDVTVPAGPTGMEPTQTSFLQALNIASKINKGQIEILNDVLLITEGSKVGPSQATLLQKLGITPFSYGLKVTHIYDDGFMFQSSVLDITDDIILEKFVDGVANVACISLATGVPSLPAVPHVFRDGVKNVMAVAVATDYTYPQIADLKALLDDPEALAAANAATSSAAPAAETKAEEKKEEEPEESSDDDMGMGLFD